MEGGSSEETGRAATQRIAVEKPMFGPSLELVCSVVPTEPNIRRSEDDTPYEVGVPDEEDLPFEPIGLHHGPFKREEVNPCMRPGPERPR